MNGATMHAAQAREVVAVYHDATRTIFLSDAWTGASPADLSVLVHEMVHHLQNLAGLRYECPAAREARKTSTAAPATALPLMALAVALLIVGG